MSNKNKVKMPWKKTVSHNWFMVKLIFSASPLYGIMLIIESLRLRGLNFVEHTFGIGFVLEAVEFGKSFQEVVQFMVIMLTLLAFSGIYSTLFYSVIQPICRPKIEKRLKTQLYEKAKDMDLACYDDPNYYNEFVLAVSESANSIERSVNFIQMLFSGLVMFFSYGAYFLVKDAFSVVFVIISFIARFALSNIVNKIQYKVRLEENPQMRKRNYVNRVFYLLDYAKELRLNKKFSRNLHEEFEKANEEIYKINKKAGKKRWGLYFLIDYVSSDFITDGIYLVYLVARATIYHAISYSGLVVLYNSSGQLRHSMATLSDLFPFMMENALYVEKIRTFLEYESKVVNRLGLSVPQYPKEIRFDNVSFAYTSSGKNIMKNINLTIRPEEKIAFVGYNGAGKTTLIKLLMRLYDPTEGRILMDGVDIRDYDITEYRNRIGTIFQDYRIYAATVEENVVMDIPLSKSEDSEDGEAFEWQEEQVYRALIQSGFEEKLVEMEEQIHTQLTREFDDKGKNLSGGEGQKLAIARVFFRDSDLIILDEPSSALDPIAEYHLNHSMIKAAKNKTVIFISHRLSTTRHADRIVMFEDGRVIEEGSHEALLKNDGKYAKMWQAQASKYV